MHKIFLGLFCSVGAMIALGGGLYLYDITMGTHPWHLIVEKPGGQSRELGHSLNLDRCEARARLRIQQDSEPGIEETLEAVADKIRCAITNDPADCEPKKPKPVNVYRCGYRCYWGKGTLCLLKRGEISANVTP